jgi:hypothetical protein
MIKRYEPEYGAVLVEAALGRFVKYDEVRAARLKRRGQIEVNSPFGPTDNIHAGDCACPECNCPEKGVSHDNEPCCVCGKTIANDGSTSGEVNG